MSTKHLKLPPITQSPMNETKTNSLLLASENAAIIGTQSPKSPKKKKKFVHQLREKIEYFPI